MATKRAQQKNQNKHQLKWRYFPLEALIRFTQANFRMYLRDERNLGIGHEELKVCVLRNPWYISG
jgi:hypothetical protein